MSIIRQGTPIDLQDLRRNAWIQTLPFESPSNHGILC